jgi:hypothetical protein
LGVLKFGAERLNRNLRGYNPYALVNREQRVQTAAEFQIQHLQHIDAQGRILGALPDFALNQRRRISGDAAMPRVTPAPNPSRSCVTRAKIWKSTPAIAALLPKPCAITLSHCRTSARWRAVTPLVVPPTVAILGAGKLQRDVVAGETAPEIHIRLSLTFDRRCITSGETCCFLATVIADLAQAG